MSKYLETKKGSLESAVLEAMSPAQQAAIAISKKEKEKNENNYIHAAKMAKEKGEKTFTIGGKEYDVEETLKTEKLVGGQKKLDKDKDGDIDGKDFAMMRKNKKEEVEIEEGYSPKEIKMAIGVASDKRYAGGDYDGAVKAIEKIKKGLSTHKQVAAVLKRQNESLAEKAARHISDMWKESAAAKDKKEDKKVKEEDEVSDTTMTGKPANKIAINPKSKEEK